MVVIRRILFTLACGWLLIFPPPQVSAQQASLWAPAARDSMCLNFRAELNLLDVSGSMRPLFQQAVEQIDQYIDESPACTYIILGRFGTTADVVADAFLTTDAARTRLKTALHQLQPRHATTNFDEAARLIEWVQFKLGMAYGASMPTLAVRVLSDDVSSPDPDKPQFSLRRYLEDQLRTSRMTVSEISLLPPGSRASETTTAGGYVLVATPVESLREILGRAIDTVAAPAVMSSSPADSSTMTASGAGTISDLRERGFAARNWAAVIGIVVLLAALALLRVRRTGPALLVAAISKKALGARIPRALRVEEQVVDKAGTVTDTLRKHLDIPVALGIPVVFGTDVSADIPLRPLPGISGARVMMVTPSKDGEIRVQGAKGLTCNGVTVPGGGALADATTPVRLELADRRWQILALFEDVGRVDELLSTPDRAARTPGAPSRALELR